MCFQLDENLSACDSAEQISDSFSEFYKLFDELGIIDSSKYKNINNWVNKTTIQT